jgi:integrase
MASSRGGVLAPRTVRSTYFTVRQVFQEAVLEEALAGNPIIVARGVLPKLQDKDPGWRPLAVFTLAEGEALISDPRISKHRRVNYGIELLTGLRTGQVSGLTWADYDPDKQPLGCITSSFSWDSKKKVLKRTKTGVTHAVPVHPTLAKVLAEWKLTGWRTRMGRAPRPSDLIVPTINGGHRDVRKALEDFHEDLVRLGLRKRRHYDARRTFISLALDGGASKDLLMQITHPRPADAFDLYRTPSWDALCATVGCIKMSMKEGRVIELRDSAASNPGAILAGEAHAGGQK